MEQSSNKTTEKKPVPPELQKARDGYKAQTNKNAHHTWNVETIAEKLAAFTAGGSTAAPAPTKEPKDKRIYAHLKVYKGIIIGGTKVRNTIAKDDVTGETLNENQLVKLTHGSMEWVNYLKQLPKSSWFRADVVKVLQGTEEISGAVTTEIQKEVNEAYNKKN